MTEPRAAYGIYKGKEVMAESKKGIVEKTYPTGMAKVRLAHGIWIGPLDKL